MKTLDIVIEVLFTIVVGTVVCIAGILLIAFFMDAWQVLT